MINKDKKYIEIFEDKMRAKSNFLSSLKIKNTTTNEEINFNNNIEYIVKNDYMYLVYNSITLEQKFRQNDDYVGIFLTNTLDSKFHEFRQLKNGKLIKNKKFVKGNTINLGYKILTKFFKSIYNDFKVENKFIKTDYIRVIEPHCDFTCHLHALVFVQKDHLDLFLNHYERKVKNNKNLGIYKVEVIKNINRSASYILKYASKNYSNDKYKVYYGWRLEHKIRAYTFTRQFISRDLFNKLSFHLSKNFVIDTDSINYFQINNYFNLVDSFTKLNQDIIDTTTGEISTKEKDFSEDDMFVVHIQKYRTKIKNSDDFKIFEVLKVLLSYHKKSIENELNKYRLLDNFNYFVHNLLSLNTLQLKDIVYLYYLVLFLQSLQNNTRYQYKIDKYQAYKKHHSNSFYDLVYDKSDWQLIK